jgi:hypothetical protein
VERAQADPLAWGHLNPAAAQAASGSKEATEKLLETLGSGEQLHGFLKANDPQKLAERGATSGIQGMANLISTAAQIQPPTERTMGLFAGAVDHVKDNQQIQSALANFFTKNSDAVIAWASSDLSSKGGERQRESTLSKFCAQVAFGRPFKGQEQLQASLGETLRERVERANSGQGSLEERLQLGREVGTLVGSAEAGLKLAASRPESDVEAARKGMARLVFHAVANPLKNAIPFDVGIPGLLKSVKDVPFEKLESMLMKWATEKRPDAGRMIQPLYDSMRLLKGQIESEATNRYLLLSKDGAIEWAREELGWR